MMKKILLRHLLLSLMLFVGLPALAETFTDTGSGLTFDTLSDSTLQVYKCPTTLEIVKIPSQVTYNGKIYTVTALRDSSFFGCTGLTEIEIPASVSTIGASVFDVCTALENIIVAEGNTAYSSSDGILYNAGMTELIKCPAKKTEVVIPATVNKIKANAFVDCSNLTKITLLNTTPATLETNSFDGLDVSSIEFVVPNGAFAAYLKAEGWKNILSSVFTVNGINYTIVDGTTVHVSGATAEATGAVTIPDTVNYYGTDYAVSTIVDGAFTGNKTITSLTIEEGIKIIGRSAFKNSALTSVSIPSTVTSLRDECFYRCTSLTEVEILGSVTSLGQSCFFQCSKLSSITLPETVTSLGKLCFYNCSNLTEINIPESVTSLGESCFSGCKKLTKIEILGSLTSLGEKCFYDCAKLSSITIPASVTSLGDECFSHCTGLKEIEILGPVTSMGENCFNTCSQLSSITIPETVTSLGEMCFYGCRRLTEIEIPANLTTMGTDAFGKCTMLDNFTVAEDNTAYSSSDGILYNADTTELIICPARKLSVTIPASVEKIEASAFADCSNLNTITLLSETPIENVQESSFSSTIYENAELKVPEGSEEAYKAANVWKDFKSLYATNINGVSTYTDGVFHVSGNTLTFDVSGKQAQVCTFGGANIYLGTTQAGESVVLPTSGTYLVVIEGKSYKVMRD